MYIFYVRTYIHLRTYVHFLHALEKYEHERKNENVFMQKRTNYHNLQKDFHIRQRYRENGGRPQSPPPLRNLNPYKWLTG